MNGSRFTGPNASSFDGEAHTAKGSIRLTEIGRILRDAVRHPHPVIAPPPSVNKYSLQEISVSLQNESLRLYSALSLEL